ncbi:hypothetical protein B1L04_27570 [Microcystis aeruginosa KW]|uniref:Uncharacterized protein n=1 Tax=Microcystis aeruginosa KW TaxID=1960155 RepID=A0A1V4BQ32_MICAE|nr:hypothetical protein B1L04_27570 [Microcystis aeruginosa KW]
MPERNPQLAASLFQSRKGIAGSTTIVIAGSALILRRVTYSRMSDQQHWYVAALAARLALAVTPVVGTELLESQIQTVVFGVAPPENLISKRRSKRSLSLE